MTNNPTIDGVSREDLRTLINDPNPAANHQILMARDKIRRLLDAPAVERQEPVDALSKGFYTTQSGGGNYSINIGFRTMAEMQSADKQMLEVLRSRFKDAALQSTIAQLQARVQELERCKMSIWPSEETLMAAGLGYPIGKEQAVKIYKASLQSRTDTPENADCEWCYGAGHDYYGDPCCGCCKPDQGKIAELVSELDRPAPKPFAYTTTGFIELAKTHSHTGRLVASFQGNVFWNQPLFTAPPAPVAHTMKSVMSAVCAITGFPILTSNQCHALARSLNACLDATAALNGERK